MGGRDEAGWDVHGGLLVRALSGKISVAMELHESASIDHALAGLLRGQDILLMGLADASPIRRLIDWSGTGSFWLLAMTGQRQRSRRQTLFVSPGFANLL